MNQRIRALIRKDWLELLHNSAALAPLIIVPAVFVVIIPVLMFILGGSVGLSASINGLDAFIRNFPPEFLPAGYSLDDQMLYAMVTYFMAPLFLIIPVMVASITASSSFVGEKERRTLEGLFYTPLTNRELAFGKILGSFLPAVGLTWVCFVLYTTIVTAFGYTRFGWFFPTTGWVLSMVLIVPLIAFVAIAATVAVSQRAKTMQGAQGSAMFFVLPIIALVVSQSTGVLLFGTPVVLAFAAVLAVVAIILFYFVVARFSRERMLTRL